MKRFLMKAMPYAIGVAAGLVLAGTTTVGANIATKIHNAVHKA